MMGWGTTHAQVANQQLPGWEAKASKALQSFAEHSTPEYDYDVSYYRMSLEIDPGKFYVKGSVTTWFKPTTSSLNEIGFDMNSDLTIDSIMYHNSELAYSKVSSIELIANFPGNLANGKIDSVTVYYEGIPYTNQGSIELTFHSNIPEIWTLSEPYGARDWWPCKQSLDDKADSIDILITTPIGNRVASNGLLVDSARQGKNITYHWKHRYPIATYLVGIAVTNFAEYNIYAHVGANPGDSLLIMNYVFPEDSAIFVKPSMLARNAMELYVKLYGPYPFEKEKYGQAQFAYGGGMEHQTMTFLDDMEFDLVAHEMAHHWFGDKVTCGSWKDIWLNEGFAVFSEGLCEKYIIGRAAWENWINANLGGALQQTSGSVYVDDTTSVSRIFSYGLTYCKAAYVLRMLDFLIGDSAFFKGCQSYLTDKNLAYFFANTADLQAHFEAASGMQLDSFIKEWIYGQGFPQFNIYWKQANNDLNINLVQIPTDPSVSMFHIPVPITISVGGKDSTFNLNPTSLTQQFNIPVSGKVDSLMPDTARVLLAKYSVFPLDSLPGSPLTIYPDPVQNVLTLNLHEEIVGNNGSVSVFDIRGQEMMRLPNISSQITNIDMGPYANGLYILRYVSSSTVLEQKFVKE